MFGPDLCSYDVSRIHLIFNKGGENLLKKEEIKLEHEEKNEFTHLYTLVVKPDNTAEVFLDQKSKWQGKLSEGWDFPGETIRDPEDPKEIPDPESTKPKDWVDEDDGVFEPTMIGACAYSVSKPQLLFHSPRLVTCLSLVRFCCNQTTHQDF